MAAAAVVLALTVFDNGPRADRIAAAAPVAAATMQLVPALSLDSAAPSGQRGPAAAGWRSRALPGTSWELSFDVSLAPRSRLTVELGSAGDQLLLTRDRRVGVILTLRGHSYLLARRAGWPRSSVSHHVEVTAGRVGRLALDVGRLALDGRAFSLGPTAPAPRQLAFSLAAGHANVRSLIISARADRSSLLLHRLAELHARLIPGALLLGADRADRLQFNTSWTSGFWPGALWQAAVIAPAGGMFSQWALLATTRHFGLERTPTHDLGFMYGQSSLAAWRALCRGRAPKPAICARLEQSVLQAAHELLRVAASNPGSGTLPTDETSPLGETIIDSMMNLGILTWATRVTHQPAYARLASHQAHVIASLLVRRDGSTFQAVHFERATGRILFLGTHQGLSNHSTWARGQGWGLYGFAQTATDLHDRALLDVALRLAHYVAKHLPPTGLPRWDYDAAAGAPVDVSAGTITAAGLLHLVAACKRFPGACSGPGQWVRLAAKMLQASLGRASTRPPIGFLGSQVLNHRARTCCNGGELIFGLTYALEALTLQRSAS